MYVISLKGVRITPEPPPSKVLEAQVSFPCGSCDRAIRVTFRQVLEGRSVRCVAGHRVELDTGAGLLREGHRGPNAA